MRKLNGLSLAAAALLVAACDPYPDVSGGDARIVAVTAANGSSEVGPVEMTQTGGVWTGSACTFTDPDTSEVSLDPTAIHITFNKQLNGFNIQTNANDCTPANGWLTVTPAAPAGATWYSCYSPSSPDPAVGGSVVVYLGPAADAAATPPTPASAGWADAELLDPAATYHVTGTVEGAAVDVTLNATGAACPE